jgi:hypothetical protein
MKFLKDNRGQSLVEWLTGTVLIVAVVGAMIWAIGHTTANEGSGTNNWIEAIPDPAIP